MWIWTSDAFVSIVEHRDNPNVMIVRGRFAGDAKRFLGTNAREEVNEGADYLFRVYATRDDVALALLRCVRRAQYHNFKDSIKAAWRKAIALRVWSVMWQAQAERMK